MSQDGSSQAEPPLPDPMIAAIARTMRIDARGPSKDALARASQLARLLPAPIGGGWRAWFDRAAAVIGTQVAPRPALAGVRRATGPQVLEWHSPIARVEIEIERPLRTGRAVEVTLQGQVETSDELLRHACPVAAIATDGTLLACTMIESTGYFSLEVQGNLGHLALALPGATLILDCSGASAGQPGGRGATEE